MIVGPFVSIHFQKSNSYIFHIFAGLSSLIISIITSVPLCRYVHREMIIELSE